MNYKEFIIIQFSPQYRSTSFESNYGFTLAIKSCNGARCSISNKMDLYFVCALDLFKLN